MSHTTTWMCDRCKMNSNDVSDLNLEEVAICFGTYHATSYAPLHRAEWCRACRNEVGIIALSKKPADPAITPSTLEELVREIIREEIDNAK